MTDGLRAEREQGITIDVAYRFFATRQRSFIIADTPGHVHYTRNMVTGASTADVAMVLHRRARRHRRAVAPPRLPVGLLGIRHVVASVNKMDLVDWDEDALPRDRDRVPRAGRAAGRRRRDASSRSRAARRQRRRRVGAAPWYDGPPLLGHLEHVEVARDRNTRRALAGAVGSARAAADDYRGYAGQVAGGRWRPATRSWCCPRASRRRSRRRHLRRAVEEAFPPMSVAVRLADELDVGRGDLICAPDDAPVAAREIDATICWMGDEPAASRRPLRAQAHDPHACARRSRRCAPGSTSTTLEDEPATAQLELNDIGRVTLRTSAPVLADPYAATASPARSSSSTSSRNNTVGAGMILEPRAHPAHAGARATSPGTTSDARPRAALGGARTRAARPSG